MPRLSILWWFPLVLLALWLSAAPVAAAEPDFAPGLYRVYFAGWDDLVGLAGQLDVWEVDHAGGFLVAPLNAAEAATLGATHRLEATTSPDWAIVQTAQAAGGITDYACYRTLAESYARMNRLAQDHPDLAYVVDIGDTWDKVTPGGPSGYDMKVLVVTSQVVSGPKPRFFLMAAIHARELVTSETALRFAEKLLAGYGTDPNATWLLDHAELHVLVASNPDGRVRAEQGSLWRKNTNDTDACSADFPPSYTYGVDLNRNFDYGWHSCPGCSSGDSCAQIYRGSSAASEPETQAMQSYLRTIFADARSADGPAPDDTPGLLITLHSYGRLVLYPWGMTTTPAPNAEGLAALGVRFADILGYRACQAGGVGCLYQTDGSTDDWLYGELGVAAYTFEMGTSFFQDCATFEASIAPDTLAALDYAFRVAALPYQQPQGPHFTDLRVTPATVAAGDPFTVSLRLAQPAAAVRLSFGEPPWLPAAQPISIAPPTPGAAGVIPLTVAQATPQLPFGSTLLFAQAQTSQTLAGPAAAQFITVTRASAFRVTVAPQARTVYAGDAALFRVTVTNTGAITATYVFSSSAEWPVDVTPVTPTVVGPYGKAVVDLTVTPPRGTAGAVAPAVVDTCMVGPEPDCIRATTVVSVKTRRVILPIIGLSRAVTP